MRCIAASDSPAAADARVDARVRLWCLRWWRMRSLRPCREALGVTRKEQFNARRRRSPARARRLPRRGSERWRTLGLTRPSVCSRWRPALCWRRLTTSRYAPPRRSSRVVRDRWRGWGRCACASARAARRASGSPSSSRRRLGSRAATRASLAARARLAVRPYVCCGAYLTSPLALATVYYFKYYLRARVHLLLPLSRLSLSLSLSLSVCTRARSPRATSLSPQYVYAERLHLSLGARARSGAPGRANRSRFRSARHPPSLSPAARRPQLPRPTRHEHRQQYAAGRGSATQPRRRARRLGADSSERTCSPGVASARARAWAMLHMHLRQSPSALVCRGWCSETPTVALTSRRRAASGPDGASRAAGLRPHAVRRRAPPVRRARRARRARRPRARRRRHRRGPLVPGARRALAPAAARGRRAAAARAAAHARRARVRARPAQSARARDCPSCCCSRRAARAARRRARRPTPAARRRPRGSCRRSRRSIRARAARRVARARARSSPRRWRRGSSWRRAG